MNRLLLALLALLPTPAIAEPCAGPEAHIIVEERGHVLSLCEKGAAVHTFDVRLGKHGVGKRREGDGKVPAGRYPLGAPRHSDKYGLFISIQYPTPAQRKAGYTGGDVGVHGPHRRVKWLGRLVNAFDTTDGCVGLATDDEMAQIAAWVRNRAPRFIEIRAEESTNPPVRRPRRPDPRRQHPRTGVSSVDGGPP